jgi:hypothetical protein
MQVSATNAASARANRSFKRIAHDIDGGIRDAGDVGDEHRRHSHDPQQECDLAMFADACRAFVTFASN